MVVMKERAVQQFKSRDNDVSSQNLPSDGDKGICKNKLLRY